MSYRLMSALRRQKPVLYLILFLLFFLFFYLLYRCKCEYKKNELLALELAKNENVAEIVEFYGVKIKGRNASIFMEFMAGKDCLLCVIVTKFSLAKLYHVAGYWEERLS